MLHSAIESFRNLHWNAMSKAKRRTLARRVTRQKAMVTWQLEFVATDICETKRIQI